MNKKFTPEEIEKIKELAQVILNICNDEDYNDASYIITKMCVNKLNLMIIQKEINEKYP